MFGNFVPFCLSPTRKTEKCAIVIIICCVILCAWTSPTLSVFRLDPEVNQCLAVNFNIVSADFWFGFRNLIALVLSGIIPIGGVFIFTTTTIVKLQQKKRKRSTWTTQVSRQDLEMTRQMIVVCSLFTIFGIIFGLSVRGALAIPELRTHRDGVRAKFFATIVRLCQAVLNSANFYVYLIFGRKFRTDFIDLVTRRKPASRKRNTGRVVRKWTLC